MTEDINTVNVKSSFDLKDLMNLGENPTIQNQIQDMMQNQFNNHLPQKSNKELSRDDLKLKLRAKLREKENLRRGKQFNEQRQIEQLKKNPMENNEGKTVDMLIEHIMRQNNLPDNSKQRKSVRKQVEQMVEKMHNEGKK